MTDAAQQRSRAHLTKAGTTRMITVVLSSVVTAAIFFLAAGSTDVDRAWLYYGGLLIYLVLAMAAIFVFFPAAVETVNARGKLNQDVKRWDKLFALSYTALLLVQPAVAGWDVRKLLSPEIPWPVSIIALGVTIAAYAFVHWAMIVNKHAETGVRIQSERDHAVVTSGPYRLVRHPFYISLILVQLAYPLAIGSLTAFIPSLVIAVVFVWRTAREDDTLRRELAGYEEFTKQTRYRLVPGLW
jgi:protein-S-isoprenylcysteine O-methyltransferase Ste14